MNTQVGILVAGGAFEPRALGYEFSEAFLLRHGVLVLQLLILRNRLWLLADRSAAMTGATGRCETCGQHEHARCSTLGLAPEARGAGGATRPECDRCVLTAAPPCW
jgi:hypothetical protein